MRDNDRLDNKNPIVYRHHPVDQVLLVAALVVIGYLTHPYVLPYLTDGLTGLSWQTVTGAAALLVFIAGYVAFRVRDIRGEHRLNRDLKDAVEQARDNLNRLARLEGRLTEAAIRRQETSGDASHDRATASHP